MIPTQGLVTRAPGLGEAPLPAAPLKFLLQKAAGMPARCMPRISTSDLTKSNLLKSTKQRERWLSLTIGSHQRATSLATVSTSLSRARCLSDRQYHLFQLVPIQSTAYEENCHGRRSHRADGSNSKQRGARNKKETNHGFPPGCLGIQGTSETCDQNSVGMQ